MLSVINEILKPPIAAHTVNHSLNIDLYERTSIHCRQEAFNDHSRQSIQASQCIDDLLHSRELCDHVQEQSDQAIFSLVLQWYQKADDAHVIALRYNAATMPYLCRVHSVRTKPSGHLRRIIGPRAPKTRSGSDDDKV